MMNVTLNTGAEIPILGFGVYQIPADQTKQAVLEALKIGYRLIDTAQAYGNEKEVGEAIRESGIARDEIFVTSKVWVDRFGYEECKKSVYESLEKMGLEYLDLMLLHQGYGDYYGAYRALEELYHEGKLRAIGVSNFYPDRLADICLFNRDVVPAVNQIECNPYFARFYDQEVMESFGVAMEAWAPFGEGRNNIFHDALLEKIGKSHGKSVAQVILRWLIQRGVIVLCKSVHPERIAENFDVFDFELSDEQMAQIASLDQKSSLFFNHQDPETIRWFDSIIYPKN